VKASACYALCAVALEGACLWQLMGAHAAPAYFIGLHLLACLATAISVFGLLPANYRQRSWAGTLFFFLIALCIPLFGIAGILLGLVPALWHQRIPVIPLDCLHSQALALRRVARHGQQANPVGGEGRLMGVLQHGTNQGSRLHALIATLSLDDQRSAPLLRIGLKDQDDDVRLLAYSLMMRKEKALEARIGKSIAQLGSDTPARDFIPRRALAQDFWDLAGLGNNGRTATFLLEQACTHAQAGLRLQPRNAGLQLLLGRILLRLCNADGAHTAFLQALAGGIAAHKLSPFFAETAFHKRQFSHIGRHLALGEFDAASFPLNELAAYWDEARHDA
jgi:hypothetical protein